MKLTAQIKKATDGWLDIRVVELPELVATLGNWMTSMTLRETPPRN